MRTFFFRVPALMCWVICLAALAGSFRDTGGAKWWQLVFYAFLPACFLFMSSVLLRMQKEIVRQRRRISRLEEEREEASVRDADNGADITENRPQPEARP